MTRTLSQIAGLFGITAVVAICGCEKQSPPPPARPPAAVTVNQPVQREVVEWDDYPGRLDAVDMVEVRARVSGYLESIHFKDGAEVKKGDLLFVIDPRPYQAELDRAEANVKEAESRLELARNENKRSTRLLDTKAISEEEADQRVQAEAQAAAALESARSAVAIAKLNLDYTHVTAPISGRIGRRLVTEGNLVNGNQGQSTALTTIVSLDPVYCYFDADERAVLKYQQLAREGKRSNLHDGKVECEVELANETDFPHKGSIDFVDNRVDPSTGTLRVRASFPNPDRVLQPGFFARVRVPGSDKYNSLLIPEVAIGTDQDRKFVYTVSDKNLVEYKPVTLGPVINGLRVVHDGLQTSDWVVVNGLMSVRPGAPVNPTRTAIGEKPAAATATAQK